jgi:hypothetical protein
MKKLVFLVVSLGLAFGVSAQRSVKSPARNPRPPQKVVVVRNYPPMFSPYFGFGSPFGFSRFGNRFYDPFRPQPRPSRLDMEIQDIQHEYRDRVASVRSDKDLSRRERRQRVKELKNERDRIVSETRSDYHKRDYRR